MKRKFLIALISVFILMLAFCTLSVSAGTYGDLTYSVSGGKVTITDCKTSASGKLVIPETIDGYPVTSIGERAFNQCRSLSEIVIPSSVTSIGDLAFYGCPLLADVYITDLEAWLNIDFDSYFSNPLRMGGKLYINNELVTKITIPNTITEVKDYAFYKCSSLIEIVIPDSVTSIGNGAFYYCDKLTDVYYNGTAENWNKISIGSGNDALENATFHYTLADAVSCGENVKYTLTSDGLLTIYGSGAMNNYSYKGSPFCDNSDIKDVVIENGVTSIGDYVFYNCDSLTEIVIPDSVTSIGSYAFSDCGSLTEIVIPDSVTSIGSYAFSDCGSLTEIVIPDSVTSIGNYAFSNCDNLKSVTIGNSVTSIGAGAFYNCYRLTEIVIPDSVTSIGIYAFSNCDNLKSVTIGNSVTSIGFEAFSNCDSLTEIVIPDSVTSIGNSAFYNCYSLTEIVIPDSVTSIGNTAFSNCDSLTEIVIPDSVTSIGNSAFPNCDNLKSVTIGNSVTSIGNSAFYNCSSLTTVTIGNSVTSIGDRAFYYCSSLTEIVIPDSVTSVGNSAFYYCDKLTDVYYNGTAENWNKISIGSNNTPLTNATKKFFFYVTLFDENGNEISKIMCDANSLLDPKSEERPGYTTHFYTDKECTTEYDLNAPISENLNLYLKHTINQYNYKFVDYDGDIISEGLIDYGTVITPPNNPTREKTQQYLYAFAGWEGFKEGITQTNQEMVFTAIYDAAVNQYTYKFIDENGNVLKNETVDYGTTIELPEYTPKANTQQYTYAFLGWDGYTDGMVLTDDIIFNAKYELTTNQYTYKFIDENGIVIKSETVDYGTMIELPEYTPKANTQQYTYTFLGWDSYTDGMVLIDDIIFNAKYEITTNQYTYKFVDEDGSLLKEETADYGTTITAPEISDKTEYYLFDYWADYFNGMMLTDNTTFTAVYRYKNYSITAEGLSGETTVTYNSHYKLEPQTKENYVFLGYFTEPDGKGTQITNENGESLSVYNVVGNLTVYPYFKSVYMNKAELYGTSSAMPGEKITQSVVFATDKEIMYFVATIKYPEYLNFKNIRGVDFIEATKDSERTDGDYKYLDVTCVFDFEGNFAEINKNYIPFEIEFDVSTSATVGDCEISAENVMIVGDDTFEITDLKSHTLTILPKLAERIVISGKSEIDRAEQFGVLVYPDYTADKSVVWSVNDEAVATISQDGTLTPVKNGTVVITATAKDGSEVFATKTVNIIAYAKINSLDFGDGFVLTEFNPDVRKYTVYVKENATSVSLTPTFSGGGMLKYNGASLWISGRAKVIELGDDVTTITLNRENVTDMTNSVYTVEIVKFEGTMTTVSDDEKSFAVTPINVEVGESVILALYNGDRFVEFRSAVYEGEEIPFTTDKEYTKARVMVWSDLTDLNPVCKVEEIN